MEASQRKCSLNDLGALELPHRSTTSTRKGIAAVLIIAALLHIARTRHKTLKYRHQEADWLREMLFGAVTTLRWFR
jgi:hypothetical protein